MTAFLTEDEARVWAMFVTGAMDRTRSPEWSVGVADALLDEYRKRVPEVLPPRRWPSWSSPQTSRDIALVLAALESRTEMLEILEPQANEAFDLHSKLRDAEAKIAESGAPCCWEEKKRADAATARAEKAEAESSRLHLALVDAADTLDVASQDMLSGDDFQRMYKRTLFAVVKARSALAAETREEPSETGGGHGR